MNTRRFLILPVFLLAFAASLTPGYAQTAPVISVITFEPGTVYWQRFGHNAILVRQGSRQIVYNYGIFDFTQKNFMLNFARGRMQYRLAAEPLNHALYPYYREGRWALEQRLALAPEEAESVAQYLAWNAQPENAEYRYDYFLANCSTKVRDVINDALSGLLRTQLEKRPATYNFRQQVARVSQPEPWLMLGMDAGLGPAAGQPISVWEESFIPGVLMEALRNTRRANGNALVSSEQYLLPDTQNSPTLTPPVLWPQFLAVGLTLAAVFVVLGRLRGSLPARLALALGASLLTLACAFGGIFLAGVWAFTAHWATYANQNMLLFNPLCLLLLPLWVSSLSRSWLPSRFAVTATGIVATCAVLALAVHAVPVAAQSNLHWVALFLPLHLALGWVVYQARKNSWYDTQA